MLLRTIRQFFCDKEKFIKIKWQLPKYNHSFGHTVFVKRLFAVNPIKVEFSIKAASSLRFPSAKNVN